MSRTKKFSLILKLYRAISQLLLCILKTKISFKSDFAFYNAKKRIADSALK